MIGTLLERGFVYMDGEKNKETRASLYESFSCCSVSELEALIKKAATREEKAFYRTLLNFKLKLDQEKIVGKKLL